MKLKRMITVLTCMALLCTSLSVAPKIHAETTTDNQLNGITNLEKEKAYYYDLDGDGKADKIMYQYTGNDNDYNVSWKLYINDKLCISKKTNGFCCNVQICDLDTSDSYLDLFITTRGDSDGILYSSFARYKDEAVSEITGLKQLAPKGFDFYRYGLYKVNGDGTFVISADTPVYSDAIGCYICDITFQLKDNTLSLVPDKAYALNQVSKNYKYKVKKSFSVYKDAGSKQVLFQVKKGEKVTFDQFTVGKSGKVYFNLKNSKGKTGWIPSKSKDLFSNCQYWG